MVTEQSVQKQLKDIGFNQYGWGRSEIHELPHILLPDEEIFECVNGLYEGGFALLVATDTRVLLIDKKPLNFLTVEDVRFDMINEIDYSHRLMGAYITISSGEKTMKFRSYNQARLRKLITHVQHCMAEGKKKQQGHHEGQTQHLEQINQQLQAYLFAQHQHQEELHAHLKSQSAAAAVPAAPAIEPIKPSSELADYLYAQGLLAQHREQTGASAQSVLAMPQATAQAQAPALAPVDPASDIYSDGIREIFGKRQQQAPPEPAAPAAPQPAQSQAEASSWPLEINALRIAYSKLPMVLRSRKFGRQPEFRPRPEVEPI